MVNKVTLVGHLGRDPELRRLPSGAAVAHFSVATTERYRDREGNWREQTEWHDVVMWRQLAERAEAQLRKGMQVYLEGKLSTRKWEDKAGTSHKATEVVANCLRILGRRDDSDRRGSTGPQPRDAPPPPPVTPRPAAPAINPLVSPPATAVDPEGDDLPF